MTKTMMEAYRSKLVQLGRRLAGEVEDMIEAIPDDIRSPAELSHIPTHPADADAESLGTDLAIIENEQELREAIELALQRIDAGTYGRCVACGAEIPRERLDAVPYAAYCIACARQRESRERPSRE